MGQTCTLRVEGMACGACENRVQKVAKRIDGVADIVADHRTNSARVTFDPSRTSPSAIAKAERPPQVGRRRCHVYQSSPSAGGSSA